MAKAKQPKHEADISVLKLASQAIDVRGKLSPQEIRRIPSLEVALAALEQVMIEMGWGDDELGSARGDG